MVVPTCLSIAVRGNAAQSRQLSVPKEKRALLVRPLHAEAHPCSERFGSSFETAWQLLKLPRLAWPWFARVCLVVPEPSINTGILTALRPVWLGCVLNHANVTVTELLKCVCTCLWTGSGDNFSLHYLSSIAYWLGLAMSNLITGSRHFAQPKQFL